MQMYVMQIVDCRVYLGLYKHSKNHGEQSGMHVYTVRGNRHEPLHVEYNMQWSLKNEQCLKQPWLNAAFEPPLKRNVQSTAVSEIKQISRNTVGLTVLFPLTIFLHDSVLIPY